MRPAGFLCFVVILVATVFAPLVRADSSFGISWYDYPIVYTDDNEDIDGDDNYWNDDYKDLMWLRQTSDPGFTYFYVDTWFYDYDPSTEDPPELDENAIFYIYVDTDTNPNTGLTSESGEPGPVGADIVFIGYPWGRLSDKTGYTTTDADEILSCDTEIWDSQNDTWALNGQAGQFSWHSEEDYWSDTYAEIYFWTEWKIPNNLVDPDGDTVFYWWARYSDDDDYAPGTYYSTSGQGTENGYANGVLGHTPEPGTMALMALGIGALAARRRRRF